MLGKPFIYKALFPVIALVLSIAWMPMSLLHWIAPQWEPMARATEFVGLLAKGAWREPGCAKPENPYFLPGDGEFLWEPGDSWTLGFAKRNLTDAPEVLQGLAQGRFLVAGYNRIPAQRVMDDLFTRAVYLDDNTGRGGVLYASVDCIGLSYHDVNAIRAIAWGWARAAGVKNIQISATHTHAGIDTVGLWDELPRDGKDAWFQQHVIEQTAAALRAAFDARKDGQLFVGDTDVGDMFEDSRAPIVYDTKLTRFRFEPTVGKEVYLLGAGCHPEMMGSNNPMISADFPAYAARYIYQQTGAEAMFIQGAQGALITVKDLGTILDEHRKGNVGYGPGLVPAFGEEFGRRALAIQDETELRPLLNVASREFELPLENIALILALKVGIINYDVYSTPFKPYKYATPCEVSYIRLGDKADGVDILCVPGELSPEIAFGGFLGKENSSSGKAYPRKAIFEILDEYDFTSDRQIVFGLCGNFIGYIIPDNDYHTDWLQSTITISTDRLGRRHYEETVSAGPRTAGVITENFQTIFKGVNK